MREYVNEHVPSYEAAFQGIERSFIEKGGTIVFEKLEGNTKLAVCYKSHHGGGSINAPFMQNEELLQLHLQHQDDQLKHLLEMRDAIGEKHIRFVFEATSVAGKDWSKYGENLTNNMATVRQFSDHWAKPEGKRRAIENARSSAKAMDTLISYASVYSRFAMDCYEKGLGHLILPGRPSIPHSSDEGGDMVDLLDGDKYEQKTDDELTFLLAKWKMQNQLDVIIRQTFMQEQMMLAPTVAALVLGGGHFRSGVQFGACVDPPMEDFLGGLDAFVVESDVYRQESASLMRLIPDPMDSNTATPQRLRALLSHLTPEQRESMSRSQLHRDDLQDVQRKAEG